MVPNFNSKKAKILKEKLIRVGRLSLPSDHVPYAFEKRVMAAIRAQRDNLQHFQNDLAAVAWFVGLRRGAFACILCMTAAAVIFWNTTPAEADLASDLNSTLVSSIQQQLQNLW